VASAAVSGGLRYKGYVPAKFYEDRIMVQSTQILRAVRLDHPVRCCERSRSSQVDVYRREAPGIEKMRCACPSEDYQLCMRGSIYH
jgi:hypothetical protein